MNPPPDDDVPPNRADFVRVRAPNPGPMTLSGTNTYVVSRDPAWVIDPGPDDAAHIDRVRAEAERRGGIGGVLLTHSHADHTAGVERLGAPVAWGEVSAGDETHLAEPSSSAAARTELIEARTPGPDQRSSLPVGEGTGFVAHPTPGHARDHVSFEWNDVLFCGDLVLGEGSTIVPPASMGGSLADYMRSLELIRDLAKSLLAPGHGPWITDPRERIDGYLAHRLERERKLLAALESGERSREALLDVAWSDVPAELRPAAAVAMQAHIEKLTADGLIAESELRE